MFQWRVKLLRCLTVGGLGLSVGCASSKVDIPGGHMPKVTSGIDRTMPVIDPPPVRRVNDPAEPTPQDHSKRKSFELPPSLPGAEKEAVKMPQFGDRSTVPDREKAIQDAYPTLLPVSSNLPLGAEPLSLGDLQQFAIENSPVIREAEANAEASLGHVVQAGLYPNPTVGYQVDQIQPGLQIPPKSGISGAGQQGGFVNQLIKTAKKLTLAQQVAGFDYINAVVAVRRAHVDVMTAVREHYFAVLVARKNLEVNQALAEIADQVYQLQLKQVVGGVAAGYEPLQLYAQAIQARNLVVQAEAAYKAAWKQLASAVGRPDLPVGSLAGRVDLPPPVFDPEVLKSRLLVEHTDILTRLNNVAQAQTREVLARRLPIPDLQTNTYHQYDNVAQTYQFGVQLGITVPIYDRNQGNIRAAQAQISAAGEDLRRSQNTLLGQLAEAYGRYEGATQIVANYRDKVLPSLSQAYRALIRRYQAEPDKVGFNDIVVAQQNYAQALQSYLTAIENQWKSVVDLANVAQLDELFPSPIPEN